MGNMFQDNEKDIEKSIQRSKKKNIIAQIREDSKRDNVEDLLEEAKIGVSSLDADKKVPANDKDKKKTTRNESLKVEKLGDEKYAEEVNRVLALKRPKGIVLRPLPKVSMSIVSSPYLMAFFKYLSDKSNRGVEEKQRIGYTLMSYHIISKALIESGEMEKLIEDDEILRYLYENFKNDL